MERYSALAELNRLVAAEFPGVRVVIEGNRSFDRYGSWAMCGVPLSTGGRGRQQFCIRSRGGNERLITGAVTGASWR
jgi:hypothetical protein